MKFASKKLVGAGTDTVIVDVPTGYRARILHISVSASVLAAATGTVTVRFGLAANHVAPDVMVDQLTQGYINLRAWEFRDHMLGAVSEDITATTTAAADATVSVIYELLKDA